MSGSAQPGVVASLIDVPPPHGQRVLTKGNIAWVSLLTLVVLLLPVGLGLGAFGLAAWLEGENNEVLLLQIICGIAGFGLLGISIFIGLYYGDLIPGTIYYRLSRRSVAERPDAWVNPDDPAAKYIQVIPRAHWQKVMLENASDVGFLKVDAQRQLLLFEGDRERWVIPAESLNSLVVEQFLQAAGEGVQIRFTILVLRLRTEAKLEERCFALRHISAKRRGPTQQEAETRELAAELQGDLRLT